MNPIDRFFHLLRERGAADYGEGAVSQYEHAVQCALLAERESGQPALIAASLLHDIGHLTNADDRDAASRGVDAEHERIGAALLEPLFGETVAAPVRLHVPAKRYLTAIESDYMASLSPTSTHSLMLQGGPFSDDQAAGFIGRPYAADAVLLRRWDERAKESGAAIPDIEHFRPYLATLLRVPA